MEPPGTYKAVSLRCSVEAHSISDAVSMKPFDSEHTRNSWLISVSRRTVEEYFGFPLLIFFQCLSVDLENIWNHMHETENKDMTIIRNIITQNIEELSTLAEPW